ncbi:MAG TPA: glycosyltransferase family 2 protein [Candidatus Nanoarchaeia archaeon]|nr:glycosyltransferase family 2 protein [Candidatus Nanoarchaeia archaeon]
MKKNKIFAVIPAYNEEKRIIPVIEKAKKFVDSVVVVDDGSRDRTQEFAKSAGAIVLRHLVNLGKGAALKTGCDYASEHAEWIIVLDADAQHNPEDIPRFIEKLKKYDIVFSYRSLSSKMPAVLRFGNKMISMSISALYGINLKDSQCGFRAFSNGTYKKIRWDAQDYSMESEMIARAGKQKLKYVQVPIKTLYSDNYKGTTILDGIKIFWNMVWWKISSR